MGRKIFVSYKYADSDVQALPNRDDPHSPTTVRDYVNVIERRIDKSDSIYKGESDGEDLSYLAESTIREKLGKRIKDSSVTILFISPNMKEPNRWESKQWIPWEISHSLRRESTSNGHSLTNALLGVVLPDKRGSYAYFNTMSQFRIVLRNVDNRFMFVTEWGSFIKNIYGYVELAEKRKLDGRPCVEI